MASQRSSRRPQRASGWHAYGGRQVTAIRCERCGRRLAELAVVDRREDSIRRGIAVDGLWHNGATFELAETLMGEVVDPMQDDWRRIVCPRCGHDWRGRTADLVAIIDQARALGLDSIALAQR